MMTRATDCDECGSECRTLVYAANVGDQRGPDGYGYRGEYEHVSAELLAAGEEWHGEQCGDCGNTHYTVNLEHGQYRLVCSDDERQGCGRTTLIVKRQSHYVVF